MLTGHNTDSKITTDPTTFLWSYIRPYRLRLLAGVTAIACRDLIAFTIPLLIRKGIDALIHAPRATAAASVAVVAGGIAIAAVPRFSFQTASRLSLMTTSRNIEFAMRRDLLRHFFRLDYSYWAKTRVGDAMAHATNDLNAVRMMVGPGASSLSECLAALPITVVVMASVNWRLTLVALLPTPLAILIVTRSGRIIRRRFEAIQSIFSTMSAAVQQTVSGVRVVRAFAQEKAEAERFEVMNRSYAAANRGLAVYSSSVEPLLVFTTGLSVAMVLWYGGLQVLEGQLSIGNFVMFTTYTALLSRPVASLGRAMNMIQRGRASVRRLHVLFSERPRIASPETGRRKSLPASARGRITLEDVTVRHGSALALDQVMLDIPAGSTVAIFGATGSGKSTLARLIPRLIDPSKGRVLIDGVDIRSLERKFDELNSDYNRISKRWVTANAWFMPLIELLGTISQAALLLLGAWMLKKGELTIGIIVAFLQYATRFLRPIQEIGERYGVLQSSVVSAEKVFALLDTPAPVLCARLERPPLPMGAEVEFDHVWFAYSPGQWILRDVSFRAGPGETLAIAGHTGAGKTTIINLLLRFYGPQRGVIRVGGVDIRTMKVKALRRQFGVVLQEGYVREGTILDNIRFGAQECSEQQALDAAEKVGLLKMARNFSDGLETQVHERGENLSSGQKQLLAFARALAHDPKCLILDEATSSVDSGTEGRMQKALDNFLHNRTSIIIAHRLSTIVNADRIVVLHKGRVAETGDHDTLLAHAGLYWRLFQLQSAESV